MPALSAAPGCLYPPTYSLSRQAGNDREAFTICGPVIWSDSLGVFTTTTGTDDGETTFAVGRDATVLATGNATFATLTAPPATLEIGTRPVSAAVETTAPCERAFKVVDMIELDKNGVLSNPKDPLGGGDVDTAGFGA